MPDLVHPHHPKLRLFKQPNGKSDNWNAWFHFEGKKLRKSMGTTDLMGAQKAAENWYHDTRSDLRRGTYKPPVRKVGPTFATQIEPMLARMEIRRRAERYVVTSRTLLREGAYVRSFWGKLPLAEITTHTWDGYREWLVAERAREKKKPLSERTLHQHKNAVAMVLKHAHVGQLLPARVRFEDHYRERKEDARPRVRFSWDDRATLIEALAANERAHQGRGARRVANAEELTDFVSFMVSTGLRVGETTNLKVCDVEVARDEIMIGLERKPAMVCRIRVTGGKRGPAPICISTPIAVRAFRRICERRGIEDSTACREPLFLRHHRDAFKRLLREHGLYEDGYGRKRDFVSLRHTYICERLEDGATVYDVAHNTRTSLAMIDSHYAKRMPIAGVAINYQRFDPDLAT